MAVGGVRSLRSWTGDTLGGLPATFWYLWLGTLINRLGAVVVLFLEIHVAASHLTSGPARERRAAQLTRREVRDEALVA